MPIMIHAGLIRSLVGVDQSFENNIKSDDHRPYRCPFCDRPFRRLEHMTRHTSTHTREKPYVCQYLRCLKTFSRSDDLIRHTRIHGFSKSRRTKGMNQLATTATAHATSRPPEGLTEATQILSSLTTIYPPAARASSVGSPISSIPLSYAKHSATVHTHLELHMVRSIESSNEMKDAVDSSLQTVTVSRFERFKQEPSNNSLPHPKDESLQHILCSNNGSLYDVLRPPHLIEHQSCVCLPAQHNRADSLPLPAPISSTSPRLLSLQTSDHAQSFERERSALLPSYIRYKMYLPDVWNLSWEFTHGPAAPKLANSEKEMHDEGAGKRIRVLRISELLS